MHFGPLDITFALLLLTFALVCCFKGFINSVLGKAAFILGLVCAVLLNSKFSFIFSKKISSKYIAAILTGVCIFIVVFIIIKIIQQLLDSLFSGKILKSLDRALGFFIGLLFGFLIIAFALKCLELLENDLINKLLNESYFYYIYRLITLKFFSSDKIIDSETSEVMFKFLTVKGLYNV